ncbi:hypothetical protein ACKAWT_03180 [Xanthomonas vasicola]|uniref:Uncharacterized protein n=2 Tax=Xanthomonas vasicola pv. vasculorum TaxID=325776 RepID=A0A836P066_XANVA|nr:hypothetical protein [Xanthomonas vasicola]KEZ97538.1 hypothetical protein A11M_0110200 [Xanthomonas vasicola pv. vasculorum NCPPB 895]KFA31541.1 hypothetical protein KW5_0102175 [Xanthomonas vasicola pv. vasculorum NCPPB 1326]KFA36788.1 hypothetical protein KWG_0100175 [Xanthomonas vasicola pv. vasculorum NCPPB 1381]KFA37491.1 hypothetical protein KWI_0104870 [Xanthomonas vasicola pv. vasculorum NCPPB 206]KGR50525.1 hypothetical protein NX07_16295 [Xanthomonas vasicola]
MLPSLRRGQAVVMSSAPSHRPMSMTMREAAYWYLRLPTHQNVPLFADWRCARAAAASLALPRHWPGAQLLCWVLLPDAWCGLLQAPGKAVLLQVAATARLIAANAVNRARGRGGTVWQPQMEVSALPPRDDHRQFARTLVAMPLRAGLAEQIGGYPYWDAVWLLPEDHNAAPIHTPHGPAELTGTGGTR